MPRELLEAIYHSTAQQQIRMMYDPHSYAADPTASLASLGLR